MKLPQTPFAWPTTAGRTVTVHMVKDDIVLGTHEGEKEANAWSAETGLPLVPDADRDQILDLLQRPAAGKKAPYTVVFFIDSDYGVETFVQEVFAKDVSTAWRKGVKQARKDGGTMSGRTLFRNDWDKATEIGVFRGHGLDAYRGA